MRARLLVGTTVALAAVLLTASPAAAKGPEVCKILKKSEIASVFGGTVGSPKKGLKRV